MEVSKISSVRNQNFNGNSKTEEKQAKTPEQVKEGKKKLALALTATAAIAAAGIGIAVGIKKGKIPVSVKYIKGEGIQTVKKFTDRAGRKVTQTTTSQICKNGQKAVTKVSEHTTLNGNKVTKTVIEKPSSDIVKFAQGIMDETKSVVVEQTDGTIIRKTSKGFYQKELLDKKGNKVTQFFEKGTPYKTTTQKTDGTLVTEIFDAGKRTKMDVVTKNGTKISTSFNKAGEKVSTVVDKSQYNKFGEPCGRVDITTNSYGKYGKLQTSRTQTGSSNGTFTKMKETYQTYKPNGKDIAKTVDGAMREYVDF